MARAREHGLTAFYLPCRRSPPERREVAATHHVVRLINSHRRSRAALEASVDARHDGLALHRYVSALLIGFSLFVLAQARRHGVRRIYFLARDGHLPLDICKRLVERSGAPVELSYLQVSRQAIAVPAMTDDIGALAEQVRESLHDRPLRGALDFLGIDASTTSGWLAELGLDPGQAADADPAAVRRLFLAREEPILARLGERRTAALAYLDQAGFLAPGRRLVVDVGWRGSVQSGLAKLTGLPDADIVGCYLGLLPTALRAGFDPRNACGYLFSFGDPRPIMETVLEGYILLELFFSAPHGTVLHYETRNSRVEPVHAVELEPSGTIRRRALAAVEAGCRSEFEALDAVLEGAWPEAIDAASALFDLEPLLTRPTAREVAAINRIPFIRGVDGAQDVVAVSPVPLREFLRDPAATLRRFEVAPWRSGKIRASLPWPASGMSFHVLRHRVEQLRRLFRDAAPTP